MWFKRIDNDGNFEYLTRDTETIELKKIMKIAKKKAEELCDTFYKDDPIKWLIEESWLKNRIEELKDRSKSIDIYIQEIKRLFTWYNLK